MSVSEQRAIELAQIDPPRSIDRITRFAEDISASHAGSAFDVGSKHLGFAATSFGLLNFNSLAINPFLLSFFLDRHQIGTDEFRDFARWLTDWNRARVRMEYIRLPLAPGEDIESSMNPSGYYTGPIGRESLPLATQLKAPTPDSNLLAASAPPLQFGASSAVPEAAIDRGGDGTPKFEPPHRSVDDVTDKSRSTSAQTPAKSATKREPKASELSAERELGQNRFDTFLSRTNQRAVPAAIGFGGYTIGAVQSHEEMSPIFRGAATSPHQGHFNRLSESTDGPELVWTKGANRAKVEDEPTASGRGIDSKRSIASVRLEEDRPSRSPKRSSPSDEFENRVTRTSGVGEITSLSLSKTRPILGLSAGVPIFHSLPASIPDLPSEDGSGRTPSPTGRGVAELAGKIPMAMGALGPNLVRSFLPNWTSTTAGETVNVVPGISMPKNIKPEFDVPSLARSSFQSPMMGPKIPLPISTVIGPVATDLDQRPSSRLDLKPRSVGVGPGGVPEIEMARSTDADELQPRAELAELTLVAPPLEVASTHAEQAGTAVSFKWQTLVQSAAPLDSGSFAHLRESLPPGAEVLYPAVPRASIGSNAVNLRLARPLATAMISSLSATASPFLVQRSFDLAGQASGSSGPTALAGSIVPGRRPMGKGPVIPDGGSPSATGALRDAGGGSAQRGGALDFLGMPIRLAPSLSGRSDIQQQVAARKSFDQVAGANMVRPEKFASLRNTLFSPFQSVTAEPAKEEWRKAAPDFGLKSHDSMSILAPEVREGNAPSAVPPTLPIGRDVFPEALQAKKVAPEFGANLHPLPRILQSPEPRRVPRSSGEANQDPMGFSPLIRPLSRFAEPLGLIAGDAPPDVSSGPEPPRDAARSGIAVPRAHLPGTLSRSPLSLPLFGSQAEDSRPTAMPEEGERTPTPARTSFSSPTRQTSPESTTAPRVTEMMSFGTSAAMRAPDRLIAPNPTPIPRSQGHMPIQRSAIGSAMRAEDRPLQVESVRQSDKFETLTSRDKASEVNAMAREVWTILRQRLSAEAVRRGRYS